jgi:hypothetical protein
MNGPKPQKNYERFLLNIRICCEAELCLKIVEIPT